MRLRLCLRERLLPLSQRLAAPGSGRPAVILCGAGAASACYFLLRYSSSRRKAGVQQRTLVVSEVERTASKAVSQQVSSAHMLICSGSIVAPGWDSILLNNLGSCSNVLAELFQTASVLVRAFAQLLWHSKLSAGPTTRFRQHGLRMATSLCAVVAALSSRLAD